VEGSATTRAPFKNVIVESSREKYILNPGGHSIARSLTRSASFALSGDGRDASVVTRTTKGGSFHFVFILSLRSISIHPSLQDINSGRAALQYSYNVAKHGHVSLAEFACRFEAYDVSLEPIMADGVASAIGLKTTIRAAWNSFRHGLGESINEHIGEHHVFVAVLKEIAKTKMLVAHFGKHSRFV
jgi:hypothetical protein